MNSPVLHRIASALAAVALIGIATGGATAKSSSADLPGRHSTLAGSYLAARSADLARDVNAAAGFYGNALNSDPGNPALIERLLLLDLTTDRMDDAFQLAPRMIAIDNTNPSARIALALQAIKAHRLKDAHDVLGPVNAGGLAVLTAGLLDAWIDFGDGQTDKALARIDALKGPDWYTIFKYYHTALILDAAGRTDAAVAAATSAYKIDPTALRVVDGYARILARAGKSDEAIRALTDFAGKDPLHPVVRDLFDEIRSGKPLKPAVSTMEQGAAEALYGLGSAIGTDEGPELPASYLRLALYLDRLDYLPTMALGDVFQIVHRCDEAIAIYQTVPHSITLRRNADLQIGNCLAATDKPDEAATYVKRVLDANPKDIEAANELGNIYRNSDRFALAASAYSAGIAAIGTPIQADWRSFYYRGVAFERAKEWPKAEADFNKALTLNPDQPQVLNYLGYSWVDRGEHLDKALAMIKKAVDLSPNDGYIVDSLGWAYHKLGRDEEAVKALEAATLLKPEDATINDHLGDAYWKVGRKLEALFQWAHARDLGPEKGEMPKIIAKLAGGLNAVPGGKRTIEVGEGDTLSSIAQRIYGDPGAAVRILNANKDRISDPNAIHPGMTLDLPPETTD